MRLLLVDDHAIVRAGVRRLLAALADTVVIEAADAETAMAALRQQRPDVVVLDLNLPGCGGLLLLRRILEHDPAARVLILTMHADQLHASRTLRAGARGFMTKNATPEELLQAIQRVAAGGRYVEAEVAQAIAVATPETGRPLHALSDRDLEIMRLLAQGESLREIADALGVAYKTVANGCTAMKTKLGVARTADLVRLAVEFRM
jgi:DNA-binding NarL/FixJ family response regulator